MCRNNFNENVRGHYHPSRIAQVSFEASFYTSKWSWLELADNFSGNGDYESAYIFTHLNTFLSEILSLYSWWVTFEISTG